MIKHLFILCFSSFYFTSLAQYQYIEDPQLYQENREASHAHFIFDTQEDVRHLTENPNYLLLNGDWLFQHSYTPEQRPLDFYQEDYDTQAWATIPVPGDWQMYGYDYPIYTNWKYPFKADKPNVPRDFNPVGSYKKNFTLPSDWKSWEQIVLHFGGVNSCFFVWINGKYVGYSQDSKLPAEFLASPFLHTGKNQIAVEVYKYCDGTYLEDQDMWRLSGIERDVYLYKKPKVNVSDLSITSTLSEDFVSGELKLELNTQIMGYNQKSYQIQCELLNPDGEIVWRRLSTEQVNFDSWGYIHFNGQIDEVQAWSAQQPYLYELSIKILDENNHLMQCLEEKVGFRSLHIEDGIFFINGDTALIKGVNRHEHDPHWGHAVGYTGNVFNEDSLRKDLELIKSLNFNAVRTAHYPNHPAFYDLCDEIGLYVCDEANVEGHFYMMFAPFDNLAIDPDYRDAVLSRIYNMYQRDKNHPSIIMWSVGNETGTGKTMVEAYKMLKELDETRPVFNERHFFLNTIKEKHSDFNGNMYAPIDKVKKIIAKDKDKPFIWIEYAHAMGNSTGNFSDLWEFIRSEPQVQGGFIWDWRDQGIWTSNEEGEEYLGYGGHFEPEDFKYAGGLQGDGNFCANGVISADGKLHPGAHAIKHAQSNVQIDMINDTTFRFINEFEHVNLEEFNCYITWRDTKGQAYGSNFILSCPPLSDTVMSISTSGKMAMTGISVYNDDLSYHKNFFHNRMTLPAIELTEEASEFDIEESELGMKVRSKRVEFILTNNGQIMALKVDGDVKFLEGPKVNFWRALTDNDYGNKANKRLAYWRTAVERSELVELSHQQVENYYAIETKYELPEKKGDYSINYKVYGDGLMEVSLKFDLKNTDEIPRIGSYMRIPAEYNLLKYLGMGPYENYIDRYDGQIFGKHYIDLSEEGKPVYTKIPIQEMPYIRPQEYGNRTSTYHMELYAQQDTLQFRGNGFSFSAWTHSLDDIDEGPNKQGKTVLDIPKRDYVWLNIDFGQTGVGGDNSWGRKPYDKYILKEGGYSYGYTFHSR